MEKERVANPILGKLHLMESFGYKHYVITPRLLEKQIKYKVSDDSGYLFTLVPYEDTLVVASKEKTKVKLPPPEIIREIADFVLSYYE